MRRGVALATIAALLVSLGWCAHDLRGRVQTRDAHDALHRRSAALVGPALCLRRGVAGAPRGAPGVADARPFALGEGVE